MGAWPGEWERSSKLSLSLVSPRRGMIGRWLAWLAGLLAAAPSPHPKKCARKLPWPLHARGAALCIACTTALLFIIVATTQLHKITVSFVCFLVKHAPQYRFHQAIVPSAELH